MSFGRRSVFDVRRNSDRERNIPGRTYNYGTDPENDKMGKADIRDELYVFLDRGAEYAFEELRPLSVVGVGFLPGNRLTKLVLSRVMFDRMKQIEMSVKNAVTLAMDYSEDLAQDENADGERYKRKFLKSDIFYTNYEGDRKDELRGALLGHFDEMARDMAPLVKTDADGFWDAALETYDKYETEEILRHHFSFVGRVVDEFGDEIEMRFTLGPFEFDYTDEALRILPKVETRLRRELIDETDDVYGSKYAEATSEGMSRKPEMRDGESGRTEDKRSGVDEVQDGTATDQGTGSAERRALERELEALRRRVEELEDENEQLGERLEEERKRKEELHEELEKKEKEKKSESESKSESYSAEDWLG